MTPLVCAPGVVALAIVAHKLAQLVEVLGVA